MLRRSIVLLVVALPWLVACSSGTGGTGTAGDGGTGEGGGGGGGGGVTVNDCTMFVDESGPTSHKIVWDLTVASSPKRCLIIKKGQTIAYEGDFDTHPLVASGGDTPTPFASVPATGKVTFPATGTFGFVCGVHPSMKGAITVIE
jgi:hypothetical protein